MLKLFEQLRGRNSAEELGLEASRVLEDVRSRIGASRDVSNCKFCQVAKSTSHVRLKSYVNRLDAVSFRVKVSFDDIHISTLYLAKIGLLIERSLPPTTLFFVNPHEP